MREKFKGYTYIEGGVCAARGFFANGLNCGLNSDKRKNDLGLIYSETVCNTAAVYTLNKVKGAPILVTKKHLEATGGKAKAVIANSKNANTCNADGEEKAEKMCELAAENLGIRPEEVIVASTGVIGQVLPIEPIADHIEELARGLSADGNERAATAIMTTDTVKKEVAVSFELGGVSCRLGGMAKGSGMIHPNMATTLNFITTDAAVSSEMLQCALSDVVKITYNCLSIDGDTSTNDMVSLMANGAAGNIPVTEQGTDYEIFKQALYIVMVNLTMMLAKDGEGATKLIQCTCSCAPDYETAIAVAKSVIRSPLLKCAIFGEDANWGRILCAIGYAEADFDISKVDVDLRSRAESFETECAKVGGTEKGDASHEEDEPGFVSIPVCRNGSGVAFSEEEAKKLLSADEIYIDVSLNQGVSQAKAWGCDLTYDYVRINGDYRS